MPLRQHTPLWVPCAMCQNGKNVDTNAYKVHTWYTPKKKGGKMAIARNKERVTITIDKGVLSRLDAYCERSGMSRSQYVSYCVAHQLDSEQQIADGVMDAAREILTNLTAGMKIDEEKLKGAL